MSTNYHALGFARHVLYSLAVNGGHRPAQALNHNGVNRIYVGALIEQELAVEDGDGYTLTAAGWETFRQGTGYRADFYSPGLVAGQRVPTVTR